MAQLTQEQEYYFSALDEVFAQPGWRLIVEEAQKQIYQYQADALEQPNWDAVNVLRGRAQQLAELTSLEDVTQMQKRNLLLEDDDEDNANL